MIVSASAVETWPQGVKPEGHWRVTYHGAYIVRNLTRDGQGRQHRLDLEFGNNDIDFAIHQEQVVVLVGLIVVVVGVHFHIKTPSTGSEWFGINDRMNHQVVDTRRCTQIIDAEILGIDGTVMFLQRCSNTAEIVSYAECR